MMPHLHVLTDGSVNTQSKVGYGACLIIDRLDLPLESLQDTILLKRFEQTSSTKLELQICLWALEKIIGSANGKAIHITAYTDSQNIIGLPGRRERLERNHYFSKNNKRLNNFELYQQFYYLTSQINCQWIKVIGHQASRHKNHIDRLFGLVDQASRQALRKMG